MEEPIEQVKSLKEKCPVCQDGLYTYWHTPFGDHPECGSWYVECRNGDCKYEYDDSFPDLEWLAKTFNVIDEK